MNQIDALIDEITAGIGQYVQARVEYQEDVLRVMHTIGMNICGSELYRKHAKGQGRLLDEIAARLKERNPALRVSRSHLYNCAALYENFPTLETLERRLGPGRMTVRNALALVGPERRREVCGGESVCGKCGNRRPCGNKSKQDHGKTI